MGFIEKYKNNELFRASFILLILMNVANILNYLFHFIMGRMLGPAEYGVLAVLTSVIYIFSVPTASVQTLVSKYTTNFNVKNEYGKIKGMLKALAVEALILASIAFVAFSILAIFLSDSLKISIGLLIVTGIYIFGAFLSAIGVGILQGLKKFSVWGWNSIFNSMLKIILAVLLVVFGFGVYGPIIGFILGTFISFLFIFPFIKGIINSKEIKEKAAIISRGSTSTLFSILIITLMYSLDIIFAKIFFTPDVAGKYAVASMIGKMIFFGTSSISNAMFPISSERFLKENKNKTSNIINKTFFIIGILSLIAIIIMWLFPKLIVTILFGNAYLEIAGILVYIGIAFSTLAMINALVLYKISIEEFRIRHAALLGLLLIIEVLTFVFFHSSLYEFTFAFMISTIVTFIGGVVLIRKWKN